MNLGFNRGLGFSLRMRKHSHAVVGRPAALARACSSVESIRRRRQRLLLLRLMVMLIFNGHTRSQLRNQIQQLSRQ